jgi:hypothetical protein
MTIEKTKSKKRMPSPIANHSRSLLLRIAALALAALSLTFPARSPAQELARRLILKDGSYQSITKYEVKGDRVRYYSAEREEWEELPSSLVDWPATEKFEKDRAAAPAVPEATLIDKETDADRGAGASRLPQVAPGLHLPELSGMFLLDNFKGQPQLVEVQQDEGDINRGSKASILRGAIVPAAGAKQTIELDGEHATVYAHVAVPSIYINPEDESSAPEPPPGQTASAQPSQPSLDAPRAQPAQPQQPEQAVVPFDRFVIVHLKVKSGKRIVGDLKRSPSGKTTPEQTSVKTTIDRVTGGWLKLTPTEDLAPGEYAIVEMKGSQGMNLYLWPFSVNPTAPANTNPWTPDVKEVRDKSAEPEKPK